MRACSLPELQVILNQLFLPGFMLPGGRHQSLPLLQCESLLLSGLLACYNFAQGEVAAAEIAHLGLLLLPELPLLLTQGVPFSGCLYGSVPVGLQTQEGVLQLSLFLFPPSQSLLPPTLHKHIPVLPGLLPPCLSLYNLFGHLPFSLITLVSPVGSLNDVKDLQVNTGMAAVQESLLSGDHGETRAWQLLRARFPAVELTNVSPKVPAHLLAGEEHVCDGV